MAVSAALLRTSRRRIPDPPRGVPEAVRGAAAERTRIAALLADCYADGERLATERNEAREAYLNGEGKKPTATIDKAIIENADEQEVLKRALDRADDALAEQLVAHVDEMQAKAETDVRSALVIAAQAMQKAELALSGVQDALNARAYVAQVATGLPPTRRAQPLFTVLEDRSGGRIPVTGAFAAVHHAVREALNGWG